jgi:hypothetical protein
MQLVKEGSCRTTERKTEREHRSNNNNNNNTDINNIVRDLGISSDCKLYFHSHVHYISLHKILKC